VYNNGESWSEEAVRELAQEVTLERLLGENQMEYVLDLAIDEDSLARLLSFQVKRVLAHRRRITVVDRLIARIKKMGVESAFETSEVGSEVHIAREGSTLTPRFLGEKELLQASNLIHSIPRLPSDPNGERESQVYKAADLAELMTRLLGKFDGIFLGDIRRILEKTLTAWLPTVLQESEESQVSLGGPELELQRATMTDLIENITQTLSPEQQAVLIGKSQDISDGDLAAHLGRSRPWVADRKVEVLNMIETQLISQLPVELHEEATRTLLERLGSFDESASE
jgi:hypothetical protein